MAIEIFEELPKITIWIAARNEEKNILKCLSKIEDQHYPKEKMQVLIGDDVSSDKTNEIVSQFILDKPHFQLINILETINNQKGKANVLANLYEYSTGELFLITDADVEVYPNWCMGMVQNFKDNPKLGHQVGVTSIKASTIFGILQAIDWLWALTLLKFAAFFKIPLTGLGNNSAISRKAYEAVGGYAKIPFSITEDFALFHVVVRKGFDFANTINSKVFAKTTEIQNVKEFLHQRKRWMVGALQCPPWVVGLLYIQALFPFLLIILGVAFSFKLALFALFIKVVIQIILILPTLFILKEYRLIPFLIPYEIYAWVWGFTMVVFYLLPIDIDWKGRIYSN